MGSIVPLFYPTTVCGFLLSDRLWYRPPLRAVKMAAGSDERYLSRTVRMLGKNITVIALPVHLLLVLETITTERHDQVERTAASCWGIPGFKAWAGDSVS